MANIAYNTYIFYGDKVELQKAYAELTDLFDKNGSNIACVDFSLGEKDSAWGQIASEWICYISEITEDSFYMETESKWFGNPKYWNNWVKTKYPKLSVAFSCQEIGMEIFQKVDPDGRFDEEIYLYNNDIQENELEKLPKNLREYVEKDFDDKNYVCGIFLKDELGNFDLTNLSSNWEYQEFLYGSYDDY